MSAQNNPHFVKNRSSPITLNNEEWKKNLDKNLFEIARNRQTEPAFSGALLNNKETGTYYCKVCGNALFSSNSKFDSQCGWPSFFESINKNSLIYKADNSHGMQRTEILCGKCSSHLGHVFEDGPPPSHLRYCLNSLVLEFEKK